MFWGSRKPAASADTAKQRLQVLLALERKSPGGPDFLPLLQRELIDVIRKYVEVDEKRVSVEFDRNEGVSMLEVNIELPEGAAASRAV